MAGKWVVVVAQGRGTGVALAQEIGEGLVVQSHGLKFATARFKCQNGS